MNVADSYGWFAVLVIFVSFLFLLLSIPKKEKNWGHTSFFAKPPEISRYVTLPLAFPDKKRLHSWNFCNVRLYQLHPLKIPKPKTKTNFFNTARNSMSSTPSLVSFFTGTEQYQRMYTEQTRNIFRYQLQKSHFQTGKRKFWVNLQSCTVT